MVPKHPLRYLASYRGQIAAGVGCLLATNALAQGVPWVVKLTIEAIEAAGAASHNGSRISWLALAITGLAAGQALMRVLSRILIFNAGREAEYELRKSLFAHLCEMDGGFYRRFRTGDLMSRLTNDLAAVRALFGAGVLQLTNTVFAYAIALPLMLSIDGWLTMWALLPYPIMLLATRLFARGIYQRSRGQQQALSAMTATLQEDLAGIREVRSYRLEEQRSTQFGRGSLRYLKEALQLALWRIGMMPLMAAGVGASIILVLWLGGERVIADELSLGDLVALNMYVGMLSWPTAALGWMLSMWQRGISAWHRLAELLATQAELSDPATAILPPETASEGTPLVECDQLSVSFAKQQVIRDLSLAVSEGQIVALVGRLGSGKSTVADAIARLIAVPDGTVRLRGIDVNRMNLADVRKQIAYAPQDAFLFSATLRENIAFGIDGGTEPSARDKLVERAVDIAGLRGDLSQLKQGLDTMVGERGVSLSGGQRQRVALARAIAAGRRILILDDSLSAVDAETERQILSGLRQHFTNTTALIISHRLSALQHVHRIFVIDDGKLCESGTHDDLMQQDGVYAQLYRRQLAEQLGAGETPQPGATL